MVATTNASVLAHFITAALSLARSLELACSLLVVVVVIAVNLLLHFVGKVISVVVADFCC